MSRLLVVGTGPLHKPEQSLFCGQSLRTWHIARPLFEAGHQVDLVTLLTDGFKKLDYESTVAEEDTHEGYPYRRIDTSNPDVAVPLLQAIYDSAQYDAVVAINVNAAAMVCRMPIKAPIWVDLMGHMMGEAQAKCVVEKNDKLLLHFWKRQRDVVRRADRFSTSGMRQLYALVGELGTQGRLGAQSSPEDFVHNIWVSADPMFMTPSDPAQVFQFRGHDFPQDAFAVLWTGGYNTWTDVETLAEALAIAMRKEPRICFVSTGGSIPGHDEITYPRFVKLLHEKGIADRCHLLGWIEGGKIFGLYDQCNLGINFDGNNFETLLGGRNRLLNLMAAGIPVLSTLGTEISEIIQTNQLGYVAPMRNAEAYAAEILRAANAPDETARIGLRAQAYVYEHFTAEATTKALCAWAQNPCLAPDNAEKLRRYPPLRSFSDVTVNPLEAEAVADPSRLQQRVQELERELSKLQGSRLFKLHTAAHRLKRQLAG